MNLYLFVNFFLKALFKIFIIFYFFNVVYGDVTFNPRIFIQEDSGLHIVLDKDFRTKYNKYAFGAALRKGCFIISGDIGKFNNVFLSYYSQFNFSQTDGTRTHLSKGFLKIASSNYFFKFGQISSTIGIEPNTGMADFMFMESSNVSNAFLSQEVFGLQLKYFFKSNIFNNCNYFNFFISFSLNDINLNSVGDNINFYSVLPSGKDKCFVMLRSIFLPVNISYLTLHIGFDLQYVNNQTSPVVANTSVEFRERNYNVNRSYQIMGTGKNINSTYSYIIGFESILIFKCVSLQSEFFYNYINWDPPIDPSSYNGMYFQLGYFVTGERRPYIMSSGSMSTPKCNNLYGSFELSFRYSYVDMQISEDIIVFPETGKVSSYTFGINWYFNPKLKIQLNYLNTVFIYNDEEIGRFCKFSSLGLRIQVSM